MKTERRLQSPNLLLRRIGGAEYDAFARELEPVALTFKETLYEQDRPIKQVYFPTSGMVSLVTRMKDGRQIETGTVGREGVVGIPAILGATRAPGRAFCQVEGSALRMPLDAFVAVTRRSERVRAVVLLYANVLMAMMAQSAACNRSHGIEARMARWLLITLDRVDGQEFPLTQEFLAQMLGVGRPAVNAAGRSLQSAGLIEYSRGTVTVLDRAGLERLSCECYAHVRDELVRAFGT
ncbi:MAG TPA: Crp/Fnr family transcriptional regulator [Kofleriaceae bacterium]|nr:Crp/Fnr family transcriptional regulator [Kofleriaceae bacterium]